MANREYISNADARKLHKEWAEWCERTGTLWSRLCEKAGYSPSIRSVCMTQGKRMLVQTCNDFQQAIAMFPDGIDVAKARQRVFMNQEDTAKLAAEIREYLERTGTDHNRFMASVGRDAQGLRNLLDNPQRISPNTAARYRRVMAENPQGVTSEYIEKDALWQQIEARRYEAERLRNERYAKFNAEHMAKYGRPLGRAPWEMAA